MGDMGDDFRAMRDAKKERHAGWHAANRRLIDASRISYIDRDEALLFRVCGVRADFYPSTGRWRDVDDGEAYRGGAQAFLAWLQKAVEKRGLFCEPGLHRGGPTEMCARSGRWSLCPLCGAQICTRCDEPHSTGRCTP